MDEKDQIAWDGIPRIDYAPSIVTWIAAMKSSLALLVGAVVASMSAAQAQDRFAGFYAGAQAGYAISDLKAKDVALPFKFGLGQRGALGGAFAGWGTSLSGVYLGVEAEFDGAAIRSDNVIAGYRVERPYGGALSGRIGYAFTSDTLLFAKAGYGAQRIEVSGSAGAPVGRSSRDWVEGVRVGAGVETTISGGLFARLSYDVDFTDKSFPATGIKLDGMTQTGKIGIGYRW